MSRRPKIQYGTVSFPNPREGSDGDIQIRETNLGAKLFGKAGGMWYGTPLTSTAGDPVTRFGSKLSDHLAIDRDSIDIYQDSAKVASFGATTYIGLQATEHIKITGSGLEVKDGSTVRIAMDSTGVTVPDIRLDGRIILSSGGNSLGADNVIIGTDNLEAPSNTSNECFDNISIGREALKDLTGGSVGSGLAAYYNIAIGAGAMKDAVNASYQNIVIGTNAMLNAVSGSLNNVAIGTVALSGTATIRTKNVAVGGQSGKSATTCEKNTFVGVSSGYDVTSGDNNLLLGYEAGRSTSPAGAVQTGSNQLCLGDDNITHFYCVIDSISTSDVRDKADIVNFENGLAWINAMRPVTYKWDRRSSYVEENATPEDLLEVVPDGTHKKSSINIGLVAQEVLEIEQANGYGDDNDTSILVDLTNDNTRYGLKYSKLTPILVKAVQELSAKIDTMQTEINNLKAE